MADFFKDLKLHTDKAGEFYLDQKAQESLVKLFQTFPKQLEEAQEKAKDMIIKSLGKDIKTIIVSEKVSVSVNLPKASYKAANKKEIPEAMFTISPTKKLDQTACQQYQDENKTTPPGVKFDEGKTSVTVRIKPEGQIDDEA